MTKARDLANASTALSAVSATELGYLDGVTSAVQTQIDGKQAANAAVSTTELGYLDGVTSAIQTQLNSKIGSAAAINPTIVDAKGDIIAATAADTVARLAVGTNGQVLTAASGEATGLQWATPAASPQGLTLISATSCSAVASQAVTAFSSTYDNYRIIISGSGTADNYLFIKLRSGSTDSSTAYYWYANRYFSSNATQAAQGSNGTAGFEVSQTANGCWSVIDLIQPFTTNRTGIGAYGSNYDTNNNRSVTIWSGGMHNATTSYDGFNAIWTTGAFTGTIFVYGYKKS